jgi:hypothetical protein
MSTHDEAMRLARELDRCGTSPEDWMSMSDCKEAGAMLRQQAAEIERLRSDRDCEKRLRKDAEDMRETFAEDAERYAYLRNRVPAEVLGQVKSAAGAWIDGEDDEGVLILLTGADADAAIDAARKP